MTKFENPSENHADRRTNPKCPTCGGWMRRRYPHPSKHPLAREMICHRCDREAVPNTIPPEAKIGKI